MPRRHVFIDPWLMTPKPEDLIEGFGGENYVGADQHPGPLMDAGSWGTSDVRVTDGWSMAVDEEGLLRGRPDNRRAQALYPGRIVGDVLLASEAMVDDGTDWVDTEPADLIVFLAKRGALL